MAIRGWVAWGGLAALLAGCATQGPFQPTVAGAIVSYRAALTASDACAGIEQPLRVDCMQKRAAQETAAAQAVSPVPLRASPSAAAAEHAKIEQATDVAMADCRAMGIDPGGKQDQWAWMKAMPPGVRCKLERTIIRLGEIPPG